MLKKGSVIASASCLIAALFLVSGTAFAGVTYDKGDLGKYVRESRFVHRVPTVAAAPHSSTEVATSPKQSNIVDKGVLGKYVRKGRFMFRISTNVPNKPSSTQKDANSVRKADHIKHIHTYAN